jgi:hypothetical protein
VSEERIRALLQRADEAAGEPAFGPIAAAQVRRRIRRRMLLRVAAPVSVAAVLFVTAALMSLRTQPVQPQRVVSLEERVEQLQAQTDATLRLVQEIVERDRQERRLAALHAELASIPDPMQEIERQVDKTAFILVYQADKLYRELNRTESAVTAYKEVIQLFPHNRWADVARERLSEIEQEEMNPSGKGDPKCEPANV